VLDNYVSRSSGAESEYVPRCSRHEHTKCSLELGLGPLLAVSQLIWNEGDGESYFRSAQQFVQS
jgi:hypothetical protein